ncbi:MULTISPECIES: trifunctional serine/threonine-protein kinase/ATP-binding protein/sensor histidine kinase [Nostocales]|uniref:histidine kinase n=3 Tax=Nostocales TaxID=1161 RepID=A0A0C1N9X0_9CYAN|nr:ATP-binding sensor histidine kinase [Tolypothrix bouteillei]KAF3890940.1 AAA family ATPase [Tolypothrix bouteillei VB521301]
MVGTLFSISGYHITEELYNGSRTLVYRGYREADSLPVAIKLLKTPYPSFSELVQFRNQYTIAKNLNYSGIVQTYSLEPFQNGYALVMEDFGGISLKDYFAHLQSLHTTSLQEFLQIAIALCNILYCLYQERIIHKDIKPSNILINPETKQVKLIDFSIASLLPRETQTLISPNVLEGTLAYISPEQTGRMNRGIDYRTDFYSLGVTFYELLTGELPFASNDSIELVHCHLAQTAPLVHETNVEIPPIVSRIICKLMAKNSEDRYQSALGLKFDLEKCLQQLVETSVISDFEIARRDVCDRFIIPDRLYGREAEISTLLQAFDRVCQGATEIMLVAGFSGIGKTAVVNEVHKPIVRQRGYFVKGKYDQFQRNIPFSAFVQAFRDLMGQLLAESDVQLEQWKKKILDVVGENGQVLIEVIPELERIIDEQPLAIELSGTEAQNRFNLLFQKFIHVFTCAEHPLVIFLDDLQWADSASLNLMQLLMADAGHLFIIGAYRDNEVNLAHPLMLTLNEIQKKQAKISTINLAPLNQVQVNKLVADTLKCTEDLAYNISQLIHQKTKGNPFFATQFLKALHQDGFIEFNFDLSCWQCDMTQVTIQAVTDDVVTFMGCQLRKLPQYTQDILQLAACIGNQFDLATLAIVSEQSELETAAALWKALQEGLILPIGEIYKFYIGQEILAGTSEKQQTVTYKFLHDRVQQAAYSLIPDSEKQTTHYQIGQLLLQQISAQAREDRIFEIVHQLNYGTSLIREQTQRDELAQLNLIASRKAKNSTAYQAAREYVTVGLSLLGKNTWQQQYEMTLALHELAAEVALLNGSFEAMEQFIDTVIQQAHSLLEKVNVYCIRIQSQIFQSKLTSAIAIAQTILQQLGVTFPETPTPSDLQREIQEIEKLIGDRSIADLVNLPEMRDAEKLATLKIASIISPAAYLTGSALFPLLNTLSVKVSIQYGNTSTSTYGYANYGNILCNFFQVVDTGTQFGSLALQIIPKLDAKASKTDVLMLSGLFIVHRNSHIQETLPMLQEGYTSALEFGNLVLAGYNGHSFCLNSFWCSKPLATLEQDICAYCHSLMQLNQLTSANYCRIYWQPVLNLLGFAEHTTLLSGKALEETEFLLQLQSADDGYGLYIFHVYKLMLCFLFGEIEPAKNHAIEVRRYFVAGAGLVSEPVFYLYDSLMTLAQLNPQLEETSAALQSVTENQTRLQQWAHHAPMNYQHKVDLVEAEKYRVLGNNYAAGDYYDRAISLAKVNGYLQEEALANELAAKFYLEWKKEKVAAGYMQEAYYCYAKWGAKAKVVDLEKRYPQLLAPILQPTRSTLSTDETIFALGTLTSTSGVTSNSSISDILDLKAILKASQTISGEIELEKLLSSLLKIVIENAGADKCVLMLLRDDRLLVKGLISQGTQPVVLQRLPIEDSQDVPQKLIYKVKHSKQTVVLLDAKADPTLANDPYIVRQQPHSILCSPILHQGKLMGILYLENNLATGAFTSDRMELLNLLCAQAAISLENARLYESSQKYAQQLEQSFAELSAAQSRFHNLVDNVPGVVYQYHMTPDGIISLIYISANCHSVFEITPEQAAATAEFLPELVHPEDTVSFQQSRTNAIQNCSSWQWEGRIITPSGIVKWIHGEGRIEKRGDGSVFWDGLFLEISDRKKAEFALQQAQLQIIQSEKMSALGNLVAGVAHEMNNPLGFISASLKQAQPTFFDIAEHLKLYQKTFPNRTEEILDHAESVDLEYSLEDFPKILDSMILACDRLKNISTSLRTFSRADRDCKVPFNIHEGIDSTLLILKHRLKANEQRPAIEVVTNYKNFPQIECFPGQLNQVFMNLIANAIDAIEESNIGLTLAEIQAHPHRITITTNLADHLVRITIADNGKGMTEEIQQKIFDHLFTTKAVGKGTGLGLAIARSIIVEKHGGTITVNSTLGAGTEFIISLPIQAKSTN